MQPKGFVLIMVLVITAILSLIIMSDLMTAQFQLKLDNEITFTP